MKANKSKIIILCVSTKFKKLFGEENKRLN
jgi:hypothetical protein